jgi:6-pyruvoyltetrahydropterin/6-carboxytetrahydropterin synthase
MSARPVYRIFVGKDVHKFSSAHMTVFPDGTKERLHGHNFQAHVAVDLISAETFVDFALLKKALALQCAAWAERLLLPERSPHLKVLSRSESEIEFTLCDKRYVMPSDEVEFLPLSNVVVETLAVAFTAALVDRLGSVLTRDAVVGLEVTITEAAGQGGTFYWSWPG